MLATMSFRRNWIGEYITVWVSRVGTVKKCTTDSFTTRHLRHGWLDVGLLSMTSTHTAQVTVWLLLHSLCQQSVLYQRYIYNICEISAHSDHTDKVTSVLLLISLHKVTRSSEGQIRVRVSDLIDIHCLQACNRSTLSAPDHSCTCSPLIAMSQWMTRRQSRAFA